MISVTNKKTGTTQQVKVADEVSSRDWFSANVLTPSLPQCPTCDNAQSVDFSNGAYKALGGTVDEGIFDSKCCSTPWPCQFLIALYLHSRVEIRLNTSIPLSLAHSLSRIVCYFFLLTWARPMWVSGGSDVGRLEKL